MKIDLTFYDRNDSKNRLIVEAVDLDDVSDKVRAAKAVGFTHARLWFAAYGKTEEGEE